MISKSSFRKAMYLLKTKGFFALIDKGIKQIKKWRSGNPSEHLIVFRVLNVNVTTKVMIDVGASTGITLAPFADSGWRVYAFEPDPHNREVLTRTFGDYKNVSIDPRAVSNTKQVGVPFYSSNISLGISGLTAFHPTHKRSSIVDITTLSEHIVEAKIDDVDYLKIDTEGYDLFVLQGFPWRKIKPRVILCEFDDLKTKPLQYSWSDLASFLEAREYHVLISEWDPIIDYGGAYKWRRVSRYPCKLENPRSWGNIIAVSDDSLVSLILSHFPTDQKHQLKDGIKIV